MSLLYFLWISYELSVCVEHFHLNLMHVVATQWLSECDSEWESIVSQIRNLLHVTWLHYSLVDRHGWVMCVMYEMRFHLFVITRKNFIVAKPHSHRRRLSISAKIKSHCGLFHWDYKGLRFCSLQNKFKESTFMTYFAYKFSNCVF